MIHWPAPHGFLSLLFHTRQGHLPRSGATHNGLGPPHEFLIKKTPHKLAYRPGLGRHFLNYVFFLWGNSYLYHVDHKLARTGP